MEQEFYGKIISSIVWVKLGAEILVYLVLKQSC